MPDLRTVAVFGAGGKLGRYVLRLFATRGLTVRALVHRTAIDGEHVTSVRGDIADPAAVRETVGDADVVVQLATAKEDPDRFFDVSVRGTFNILEACRARGDRLKQLILFGGDAVFGIWFRPQPVPIDENRSRLAYPGYYAFSKVVEEVMAEQYAAQYGVPVSILRSSWVFEGADLLNHFSLLKNVNPAEKGHGFGNITDEVRRLAASKQERVPVLVRPDGTPLRRHIVHADDVMQALDRMLGDPSAIGQSFNVAGPAPFDYRVAADYLSRKTGVPTVDLVCPDYHPFEIDINKARSVLGYRPENDLFKMADRAIAARRENA
jgi:nucleoside-diphosphate-sugar epimerase